MRPQRRARCQKNGCQQVRIGVTDPLPVPVPGDDGVQHFRLRRKAYLRQVLHGPNHRSPMDKIAQRQFANDKRVGQYLAGGQ